jgi:hypothetical protein
MKIQNSLTIALACFLLAVSSTQAAKKPAEKAGQPLQKEEVIELLAKMDKAVIARDAKALENLIAKDVKIQVVAPTAQGMQPMDFGHDEYLKLMSSTFEGASSYQVKRQDVAVTTSPDGKAVATDLLFETIQTKNKEIRSISNERLVFGRVDGQLKLLGLSSTVVSSNE